MKSELFKIFNDIQTRTNTKENTDALIDLFKKSKHITFCDALDEVFLIIIKNYDKNAMPLKNIKEFVKEFLFAIIKLQKHQDQAKKFLNHYCEFFIQNPKKNKHKTLLLYFLGNIYPSNINNRCLPFTLF